jgi:hypothetical protein
LFELGGELRDVHDADILHAALERNRGGLKKSCISLQPA